jgi:hypothetical protein
MFINRFCVIAALLSLINIASVSAETIRLSTFKNNPFSQAAARIMTESYRCAGFKTEIFYVPGKRALVMSSRGEVEVSRVFSVGKLYPSLIRVNVSYMKLRGLALAIKPNVDV